MIGPNDAKDRDDEPDDAPESSVKKADTAFSLLTPPELKELLALKDSPGWAALHKVLAYERKRNTALLRSPRFDLPMLRWVQGYLGGQEDTAEIVEVLVHEWYKRGARQKGQA